MSFFTEVCPKSIAHDIQHVKPCRFWRRQSPFTVFGGQGEVDAAHDVVTQFRNMEMDDCLTGEIADAVGIIIKCLYEVLLQWHA